MTKELFLRDVGKEDLETFFEQQLDPEATEMASFPSRSRDTFMAHWTKSMADETNVLKTIVFQGNVAGNVVCWEGVGERNVGYWIGREYWGMGVATEALTLFLKQVTARPLFAHAAKHNIASIRVLEKCGFEIVGEDEFGEPEGMKGEELVMKLEKQVTAENR